MRNQLYKIHFENGEMKYLGGEGESIEMRPGINTEYPEYWGESRKLYIGSFLPPCKAPYSVGLILGALLEDELFLF